MSMAWKIKVGMCVSEGGGGETVPGYRKLQSHYNLIQCISFNGILESGKTPAIRDFFFPDIYVQFRYCSHVKFLGYGNGIMIMEENVSIFRREMLKYQIIYDAAIYFQVVQQEKICICTCVYIYTYIYTFASAQGLRKKQTWHISKCKECQWKGVVRDRNE